MNPKLFACVARAVSAFAPASSASVATIIATGQDNGNPSHSSGLHYYPIDTAPGHATPLAPISGGNLDDTAPPVAISPSTGFASERFPGLVESNSTS